MHATRHGSLTASEGSHTLPKRTPLILVWALSTLFWSIFTPPEKTFAARVLLFQPAWILRAVMRDSTWPQDLGLCLLLHTVYSHWIGIWSLPSREELAQYHLSDATVQMYAKVFSLLAMCGLCAGTIVFRDFHQDSKETKIESFHAQPIEDQVLPPLLITSRTTHSRLFPEKHAFAYSYLLVGVPVGMQGRISSMLSVDSQHSGWFVVDSADYLSRGSAHLSLAEKLKKYLHTQGVTDRDYAFAYLVTAPRFLDYSFNPVSFWYLYDSDTRLKYMILEVNNTFDERRMYLLQPGAKTHNSASDTARQGQQETGGVPDVGKQLVFSETWSKDFHVSPFNSRKGSYSLKATDPFAAFEATGQVRIDNTIVLSSSDDKPKIVARIYSEGLPKDPAKISSFEATKFIAAWCWVGFATFPRIVKEAFRLFFQRKLHVWYRPEVASTSLGRSYTDDEKLLEAFFRAFLTNAINKSSRPLRVVYEPAHRGDAEVVLYSPNFTYEEDHGRTLSFKVTSPAFYSRFVHYGSAQEAVEQECLAVDEKNRTAYLERPELLQSLLDAIDEQHESHQQSIRQTALSRLRWALLRRLRCPPAAASYPSESTERGSASKTTNGTPEMDDYVQENCQDSHIYFRIALKLFIGERIAFGVPAVLTMLDCVWRAILLLCAMDYSHRQDVFDVLRWKRLSENDAGSVAGMLLLANSIHIWSMVKG